MSWVKQKESVDLDQFQNIDEDSLVEALSPEELADLNAAIDPEVRIYIKERHAVPPVIQVIMPSRESLTPASIEACYVFDMLCLLLQLTERHIAVLAFYLGS